MTTTWGQEVSGGFGRLRQGGGRSAAAAALLTLAMVAAAGALILDHEVQKPLPYRDSARLVVVQGTFAGKDGVLSWPMSLLDFADYRRRNTVFTEMSVWGTLAFNLEQGRASRRLQGELVDDSYFAVVGVQPALGRFFTAAEDTQPFAHYVVVLGYDLWQDAFGGDPRVLGRKLRLNGGVYEVVGVGPRGFRGLSDVAALWVPSMLPPIRDYLTVRRERWVGGGAARLRPGVAVAGAQQQMDAIAAALAREFPNMDQGIGATLVPIRDAWYGDRPAEQRRLALAAGAILLLVAIDIGALLAAAWGTGAAVRRRGWRRERAIAVGLLFAAAAAAGLLLAPPATRALAARSGFDYPSFLHFGAAPAVVAIVAGLAALGAAVACGVGLLPRRGPARWAGVLFVVAQAGLALWVGFEAVRMGRALHRQLHADLGFAPAGVLTFRIDLKGPQYMDNRRVGDLLRLVYLPRLAAVPGVRQVALSNPTQPTDGMAGGYITIDDHASKTADGTYMTMWHSVSPDYFATLGIPVLAGRAFTARDTDSNAVIVSKPTADLHWPGRDPLGRRLKQDARNVQTEPWMTVVGVVAAARDEGFGEARPAPDIYMSIFEFPLRLPLTINFLVRPRPGVAPADLWPALRREMQAIAPEVPPYDVATLDERLAKQTWDQRYQLILRALAAGLLLLGAVAGTCAIVSRDEA